MKTTLMAMQEIHCTRGDKPTFITSDEIDPVSGEFKVIRLVDVLEPGKMYELRAELAEELLTMAADQIARHLPPVVRRPDERELLSFRQSRGDFTAA